MTYEFEENAVQPITIAQLFTLAIHEVPYPLKLLQYAVPPSFLSFARPIGIKRYLIIV